MSQIPRLGDLAGLSADPFLTAWGVAAALEDRPLNHLGDFAGDAYATALHRVGPGRIHPTASISPLAKVSPDVVIGPDVTVHEYATVRGHSVLSAGVQVGFGCEVTNTVVAQGTRLAHQICVGYSIVGQAVHLSASVVVASTHLWCTDMGHPDREVTVRLGDGSVCRTGLVKFGAIIGDRTRVGMHVALGPGLVVGADSVIYPGVIAAGAVVPAAHVARPDPASVRITPRRDIPSPTSALEAVGGQP
ncbi:hypothetical protein [Sphaerisporangium perillae]|uniref:hypothetical protein n=1 Tax=Sphaerisporangium perillae TaxID=2935860 RepID=UPI00200C31F0|nr:hypothetical protein [Sphaerisporangium perillae]